MAPTKGRVGNARFVVHGLFMLVLVFLRFTPGFTLLLFGQPAELLLCLTLMIALYEHDTAGAVAGFSAGILMDLCTGVVPGFHAGLFMLMGGFAGYVSRQYLTNNLISALLLTAAGTFLYKLIHWLCFWVILGIERPFYHFFRHHMISFLFTVLLTVPAYFIVRFYRKRFRTRIPL